MQEIDEEFDDLMEEDDQPKKAKRFKRARTDKENEWQQRSREWQRSQKKRTV